MGCVGVLNKEFPFFITAGGVACDAGINSCWRGAAPAPSWADASRCCLLLGSLWGQIASLSSAFCLCFAFVTKAY